jgi:hypothetical protein
MSWNYNYLFLNLYDYTYLLSPCALKDLILCRSHPGENLNAFLMEKIHSLGFSNDKVHQSVEVLCSHIGEPIWLNQVRFHEDKLNVISTLGN